MMVCDISNKTICWMTLSFGVLSLVFVAFCVFDKQVYLIARYRSKEEVKMLFLICALTVSMVLHYFLIGPYFDVLYFIKEYLMISSLSYICYFFLYHMYRLVQGHIFLSYFGIFIIVVVVIYLSVIGVYFSVDFFIVNSSIFQCSNEFWLLIRVAELVLSFLFTGIGVVISRSLKKSNFSNKTEVKSKEIELWQVLFRVLIGVFNASTLVSFAEDVVYIEYNDASCLMSFSRIQGINILGFCVLRVLTDYSVVGVVLYQLWKRDRRDNVRIESVSEEDLIIYAQKTHQNSSLMSNDIL